MQLLGRNGEPFAKKTVRVVLWHRLYIFDNEPIEMKTDAEGKLTLGNLEDVVSLDLKTVGLSSQNINVRFTLPEYFTS